jgi:hypothetical protein
MQINGLRNSKNNTVVRKDFLRKFQQFDKASLLHPNRNTINNTKNETYLIGRYFIFLDLQKKPNLIIYTTCVKKY